MRHEARQVPSWLIFDVGQNKGRMTEEIKLIKQKAHAFTFASFLCLVLAVPACLALASGRAEVRAVSIAAITVELLLISASVYFWLYEVPEKVRREIDR